MTYQEQFEVLYEELNDKTSDYEKWEAKISSGTGTNDAKELSLYARAKKEWQLASNNYYQFLSLFKRTKCGPNDQFGNFRLQA